MTWTGWLLAAALVAAAATAPALANDGYAEIGAGGLEFSKSDAITMVSEDLFLSRSQVRVDYVFKNTSNADVTATVAFPMPAVSPGLPEGEAIVPPSLEKMEGDSAFRFTTTVNGQPVEMQREVRFVYTNWIAPETDGAGPKTEVIDITDRMRALGAPETFDIAAHKAWMAALDPDTKKQLQVEGLLSTNADEQDVTLIELQVRFFWTQTFPAGQEVKISHSYRPVTGGSVYYISDDMVQRYCIEGGAKTALEQHQKDLEANFAKENPDPNFKGKSLVFLQYILMTANTWKGPIGTFKLTIDKGEPETILSLCIDGIKKTGPTTFVVEKTNFTPERDLDLMFAIEGYEGP